MFNTPKRTNQEMASNLMMCPPPPARSTRRAPSVLSSLTVTHLSTPSLALEPFFSDVHESESRSPVKVGGFFLTAPHPPAIPSLSENYHQARPITLQPRSSRLSDIDGHEASPIKLKPRPSYRRDKFVLH